MFTNRLRTNLDPLRKLRTLAGIQLWGYDDEANLQGQCLLKAASHEISVTAALEQVRSGPRMRGTLRGEGFIDDAGKAMGVCYKTMDHGHFRRPTHVMIFFRSSTPMVFALARRRSSAEVFKPRHGVILARCFVDASVSQYSTYVGFARTHTSEAPERCASASGCRQSKLR